jgi:hypothetical protein
LPPENIGTFFAPSLFGAGSTYFGRLYFWEACVFLGVTTVVLAAYATLGREPRRRFGATMVVVTLILGLGYHTPLFKLLYHWLPATTRFAGRRSSRT